VTLRVAVTRADGSGGELGERLAGDGFDVVSCPLIRIEPIPGPPVSAAGYDWLVVTSRVGAEELAKRLSSRPERIAAIGPGTAEALTAHGLEPDLVASRSTQEGLLEELPRPAGRVLFAGAEGARETLARELVADVVHLYRAVETPPERFPDVDLVVLASASAARSLARARTDLPCVAIGPVTSAEARRLGQIGRAHV